MRHIPSTPPTDAVSAFDSEDAACPTPLALSALQLTRAAIARWSGSADLTRAPGKDLLRISPQARWLAETREGLADWIARGGFSQTDEPAVQAPLATPVMYQLTGSRPDLHNRSADACVD